MDILLQSIGESMRSNPKQFKQRIMQLICPYKLAVKQRKRAKRNEIKSHDPQHAEEAMMTILSLRKISYLYITVV